MSFLARTTIFEIAISSPCKLPSDFLEFVKKVKYIDPRSPGQLADYLYLERVGLPLGFIEAGCRGRENPGL
jgi:hypothetical protein